MSNKRGLSAVNIGLLIILVVTLATIVRLYPIIQYSLDAASYSGLGVLRFNYLLDNGHALPSERGEVILDKLDVIKLLIIQLTPLQNLVVTTIYQSLILCLIILLFAKELHRDRETGFYSIALIVAFSILATPDIIIRLTGWNGPYAWIYFITSLYLIIYKERTMKITFLSLFFLLMLPLTYFSESLFAETILIIAIIYKIIFKREIFSNNMIVLYSVFFIAWLIYSSITGFESILKIVDITRSYIQQDSRILTLNYIAGGTVFSMIKFAIADTLASIPLLYSVMRYKLFSQKAQYLLITVLISIGLLTGVFFLWMGLSGVFQRIPLYVALFSIIYFSILNISKLDKRHIAALRIIVMISIIFSSFAYITSEYTSAKLTFSEAEGSKWLRGHTSNENLIFTDLRLSAPFTSNGYHTIGINDNSLSPTKVNVLLEEIFYGRGSPNEAFKGLKIGGKNIKYLCFSDRYTERFPGIQGYDFNFLPAPENFLERYENSNKFDVIYRNVDTTILSCKSITGME